MMLVQAASQRTGIAPELLKTVDGHVLAGDKSIPYGALVELARTLPAPETKNVVLRPASAWKLIGTNVNRLDSAEKITGKAKFGMDVQFDGLLTAVVARAPRFGAKLKSFDASRTLVIPGVRKVIQVSTGVAVVADHFWAAKLGRNALHTEWDEGPQPTLNSRDLKEEFRRLSKSPGTVALEQRDCRKAIAGAHTVVNAEYAVPYLAHTPMEPLNCTVRIAEDRCDIWVGTQIQTLTQLTAAEVTGLKPEQIHVHTVFLGGAFGRRGVQDFTKEAVEVAKVANAPVKTVWTREDDIRGGMYRAAYVQRISVGLDETGRPSGWDHTIVGQSISETQNQVAETTREGVTDSPYVLRTPAHRVDAHSPKTTFPVWYWRSVGHSFNGFVMESVVDELAYAAGSDPLTYRRLLLKDEPRYLVALNLAAEQFGWNKPAEPGHGYGIAVHEAFGTVVAQAVEVSVEAGAIRVHRVVCSVNCGIAVNPQNIAAQMEGSIVFGLTAALYGQLTLQDGMVVESNFHDYKMLRISEMPKVSVHLVPNTEGVGGIGEPGTPPIAPAVANAIFALTRVRLRELPLRLPSDWSKSQPAATLMALFVLLVTLCVTGCRSLQDDGLSEAFAGVSSVRRTSSAPTEENAREVHSVNAHRAALNAFGTVNAVLQNPRCSNCHIPGDRPLQYDSQSAHAMGVVRGMDGKGAKSLQCATCHGETNSPQSYGPHAPPGAPNWHLPPANMKMAWIHQPPGKVCRQLKNKTTNGNRDLAALLEHVSHDTLVLWGWDPGGDRRPVPVSHDDFVLAFKTWADAGAPCPQF